MKSILSILLFVIAIAIGASAQVAKPAPITYELACPAGFSPLAQMGRSFDNATGKWRANLCVSDTGDGRMLCNMAGCNTVTAAGGANTQVQYNCAGGFCGDPAATWDHTNSRLSISAVRTGALFKSSTSGATFDIPLSASAIYAQVATGGTLDLVMPDPLTALGQAFFIKRSNTSTGTITIDPFGAETFDGAADLSLAAIYDSYLVESVPDGAGNAQWAIVASEPVTGGSGPAPAAPSMPGPIFTPQRVALSAPHSVSANVQTVILTQAVSFPAAAGTYRADVRFAAWTTAGSNACSAEVIDTTNNRAMAFSGQNANGSGYIGLTGAEISAATYAAGSAATFTLQVKCNANVSVTVDSGLFTLSPAEATFLSVAPVLSVEGTGGGSTVASGSNVATVPWAFYDRGSSSPLATAGYDYVQAFFSNSILSFPASWRVGIYVGGAITSPIGELVLIRTLRDHGATVDVTPITFGGSATPTFSSTGLQLSDAIALQIDTAHDYYFSFTGNTYGTGSGTLDGFTAANTASYPTVLCANTNDGGALHSSTWAVTVPSPDTWALGLGNPFFIAAWVAN